MRNRTTTLNHLVEQQRGFQRVTVKQRLLGQQVGSLISCERVKVAAPNLANRVPITLDSRFLKRLSREGAVAKLVKLKRRWRQLSNDTTRLSEQAVTDQSPGRLRRLDPQKEVLASQVRIVKGAGVSLQQVAQSYHRVADITLGQRTLRLAKLLLNTPRRLNETPRSGRRTEQLSRSLTGHEDQTRSDQQAVKRRTLESVSSNHDGACHRGLPW